MLKPVFLSVLALSLCSAAEAAKTKPAPAKKSVEKAEAERIDASSAELNALINDSSMKPRNGNPALLEDFKEDLDVQNKHATLTTDELAGKGGLQELPPAPEAETELE